MMLQFVLISSSVLRDNSDLLHVRGKYLYINISEYQLDLNLNIGLERFI